MKKIGIVTFHFAENYGAVLQSYGLITCLRDLLNVQAEIINYHPDYVEDGGYFKLPINKKNIRANLVIAYQKINKIYSFVQNNHGLSNKFTDFRNKYLHISNNLYKDIDSLKNTPPSYDVYVCGSDQIWNPSEQYGIDPAYFLDFGGEKVKRVSYAASFGRDTLGQDVHDQIKGFLKAFSAISVREKTGVDLASKISGREVFWMPDPTILLTDYSQIIKPPPDRKPYMFSYVLRSGGGIAQIQSHIAKELSLDIVVPHNPMKRWKTVGETIYPGPEEWLGYIKHADFVVTNSFHGTVFSILFNKPFITIGLSGKKSSLNARAISLLNKVGLENRLLTDLSIENAVRLLHEDIDWGAVNIKLSGWRDEAKRFLTKQVIDS